MDNSIIKLKKQVFNFIFFGIIILSLCILLTACGNDNKIINNATIEKIDNATINGTDIYMYVSCDTNEVSLSQKVKCNNYCTWKLYYDNLGQVEIPTKIATGKYGKLLDGDNIFYIVVNSQDYSKTTTYCLKIHKSYKIEIDYYDNLSLLKKEYAYTGKEYILNYEPNLTGYAFNGWKTNYGELTKSFIPWKSTQFYIDKTPKTFTAILDVNGGNELDDNAISLNYGEGASLPVPTRIGHTFLGWYIGENALTDKNGKTFPVWNIEISDKISAHWEIQKCNIKTKVNNNESGTVLGNGIYSYSEKVTLTAITNEGYNFIGWFDEDDNLLSNNEEFNCPALEDRTFTAKWCYYTLTTDTNCPNAGKITAYNKTKISIGQKINLSAEDYKYIGYNWNGWYNDDKLVTTNMDLSIEMPNRNLTYTAKWDIIKELENFIFNSTQSECEILSVIDKSVTQIDIPTYVTSIANGALNGCSNLTNLIVPFVGENAQKTTSSPTTLFGYIFGENEYNKSKRINQKYSEQYGGYWSHTYYLPQSLERVTVLSGNLYYGAFSNCDMLKNIILNDKVTCIEEAVFNGCQSIQQITLPFVGKTKNVNNSREAVFGFIFGTTKYDNAIATSQRYDGASSKTETYYIPQNLSTVILQAIESIPNNAFDCCTTIKEIYIPSSVKQIGDCAFQYTSGLETVYWNSTNCKNTNYSTAIFFGSNVNTIIIGENVESIPNCAFAFCKSLTQLSISENSKLKFIGEDAFSYCSALTEIYLPKSISMISYRAFFVCINLSFIKYAGNETDWANISIGNDNEYLLNAELIFNSKK